jgi:hypothetical protein
MKPIEGVNVSNDSLPSAIATEIAVMVGTLATVYGTIWAVKKLKNVGSALKTSVASKAKS